MAVPSTVRHATLTAAGAAAESVTGKLIRCEAAAAEPICGARLAWM